MFRRAFAFAITLSLLLVTSARGGQFNPTLKIGDAGPVWSDLPGTDGKPHSLADFKGKDIVVVVFTCNSCPYAVDYQDRLIAFAKQHGAADSQVGLVAINVNTIAEDNLAAMKERAKAKEFNFPYLYDESQKIAKDYGATYTPEFFVLDKARKIVYMGAMDDRADTAKVKTRYVEDAVKATLAGQKVATTETPAVGCGIRYARTRTRPK